MTQVQKIIASALGKKNIERGRRVYINKKEIFRGISFDDEFCGAYGSAYIKDEVFSVPGGVFVDLCGALGNDAESDKIARYFQKILEKENLRGMTVEIGGDSMSYLTMEDRFAVVKTLNELSAAPFCSVFECDYITAEYTFERFHKKPSAFFNGGPQSYEKIFKVNLEFI